MSKKSWGGWPRCVVQIIHSSQTVKSPPFKTEELEHQLVEANCSRSHNLPAVIFLPSNLTCIRKKLTIYVNFRRQDKLTIKLLLSITPRKQICPNSLCRKDPGALEGVRAIQTSHLSQENKQRPEITKEAQKVWWLKKKKFHIP